MEAMEKLKRRREEYEWAIPGDFDSYVENMSIDGQWGGEFELLMLSQVLSRCIEVYMMTTTPERSLTKVQTYGERFIYTAPKPICLLLEDCHYFALVEDTL